MQTSFTKIGNVNGLIIFGVLGVLGVLGVFGVFGVLGELEFMKH